MDEVKVVEEAININQYLVPFIGGLLTLIFAALTLGIRKLVAYVLVKANATEAEAAAIQALLEGMAKAQDDIVREAKIAAADGKLTKAEIEKAEWLAIQYAKEAATGPAKDIVIGWSTTKAKSLIKQLLAKIRG